MNALVFGAAGGVWDEVAAAQQLTSFDAIIAVKRVGYDYPGHIDHWVSFHVGMFPDWIERRRRRGYPEVANYWASTYRGNIRVRDEIKHPLVQRVHCEGGSSGLIGVMVALKLGIDKVVLAGIPMDPDRAHYNSQQPWQEALQHRGAWQTYLPKLQGKVRSMSGWTQTLLGGAPDEEWLAS